MRQTMKKPFDVKKETQFDKNNKETVAFQKKCNMKNDIQK